MQRVPSNSQKFVPLVMSLKVWILGGSGQIWESFLEVALVVLLSPSAGIFCPLVESGGSPLNVCKQTILLSLKFIGQATVIVQLSK